MGPRLDYDFVAFVGTEIDPRAALNSYENPNETMAIKKDNS